MRVAAWHRFGSQPGVALSTEEQTLAGPSAKRRSSLCLSVTDVLQEDGPGSALVEPNGKWHHLDDMTPVARHRLLSDDVQR
jgi:hypothetical protein